MFNAYRMMGGAPVLKKLKVGASISKGVITIGDDTNDNGEVIPSTTTSFADSYGLALDDATFSTTQGDAEGLVTVDVREDAVIRARVSGGASAGTDMVKLSNTTASAAGTTITDSDVGSADMTTGTVWGISGNNVSESRIIKTHNSGVSFVCAVPFPNTIAVGDEFLFVPYSRHTDGGGNLQATTDFKEANGAIAAGTGGVVAVVEVLTNKETDSFVDFRLMDHVFAAATL